MAEREADDGQDRSTSRTPRVAAGALLRPRLIEALAARFESRLVKVIAPAGFGKTTAVAHAMEQNQLSPLGLDVWLPVSPNASIERLLHRAGRAIDGADSQTPMASADDLIDRVWALAPEEVCLVFDDVHHGIGSPVEKLIADLVDSLPTNGHVLITSRREVRLSSAALVAAGGVDQLGAADLEFTDPELLLGQDIDALRRCRALLDGIGMDVLHQVFVALEIASVSGGITAMSELEKAVAMASEAGDLEVVALLAYRMTQTSVEETTRLAPSLARVVDSLRGHDFAEARVAVAHADIVGAMADGALPEVHAGLDVLERIGTPVAEHIRARVLHELGRPEDIINGGDYVPEGTEAFWGYAMWLRGVSHRTMRSALLTT